ncbi:hypothetical protein YQE_02603, partial [Dendroctonus ponderosae]
MGQNSQNNFKNVIWTDEAQFSREGIFNRRNKHFWADCNPHVDWPARSPDLTAPDFFLWGKLKENIYKAPVNNIGKLRRRIIHCIGELDGVEIQRTTNHSVNVRILKCLESNGRHFENLL